MIDKQLHQQIRISLYPLHHVLHLIAKAWHSSGAEGIAIMFQGEPILTLPDTLSITPETMMLKAPLETSGQTVLLCVVGMNKVEYQTRLFADVRLLQKLLSHEEEIEHVTDELVMYQDQIIALYNLNHALRYETQIENILFLLAQHTSNFVNLEDVFVMLRPKQDEFPLVKHAGVSKVFIEDTVKWFDQMEASGDYRIFAAPLANPASTLLMMPIETDGKFVGAIGIINPHGKFNMPEIKLIRSISDQASSHIYKAMLYQNKMRQERMSAEMNLAHRVQTGLLPDVPHTFPSLEVWAYTAPAQVVGGDFYHFATTDEKLRFALGDVAGKGISAALLMVMCRTVLQVLDDHLPSELLSEFTTHLYDDFTRVDSFVTLFIGEYNTETNKVTYANGGHAPVIYCPVDAPARMLDADSPPVGVLPTCLAENHELQMNVNDLLIITSDGIPEATQRSGDMLGYDNMIELIQLFRHEAPQSIGEILLQAAQVHETPADDQTLLIIKRVQ